MAVFHLSRDLKKSVATSADKLRQDLTDRETLKVLCATAEKRRGLSVIDKPNALLESKCRWSLYMQSLGEIYFLKKIIMTEAYIA